MIRRYLKDRSGASAIEYALIAALVSVLIFAALMRIGDQLAVLFS